MTYINRKTSQLNKIGVSLAFPSAAFILALKSSCLSGRGASIGPPHSSVTRPPDAWDVVSLASRNEAAYSAAPWVRPDAREPGAGYSVPQPRPAPVSPLSAQ